MTTQTIPTWRIRLMQAHEHETIPTAKQGGKSLTSHAAAAKMIRSTLKKVFPGVVFEVKSDSFSGGNSVDIHWTDGPTTAMVETVVKRHQYGHFDGMIDLYEYSNNRIDIPQAKYVQTQRKMSDSAQAAIVDKLNREWGWSLRLVTRTYRDNSWIEVDPLSDGPMDNGWGARSHEIHRTFGAMSLICPACDWRTQPGDNYCELCGAKLHEEEQL